MKVVAGSNGHNAQKLADWLKAFWPVDAARAYTLAQEAGFGERRSLVVITKTEVVFRGDEDIHSYYRETFDQPEFNPRWEQGAADYVVVVDV
jgi:hypothetical protein